VISCVGECECTCVGECEWPEENMDTEVDLNIKYWPWNWKCVIYNTANCLKNIIKLLLINITLSTDEEQL
jgi:hypothetical protein